MMQAITKYKYGGPEVLRLEEVEKPTIKKGQLLVKVIANSANPADWHIMRGAPYFARFSTGLFKPKNKILGADFAGIIEELGEQVSQFKVGDSVFGEGLHGGAFAEYVCVPEECAALMPAGTTYNQMASVPIAGLTALQALGTHGNLKAGESVFINGSSGGVGHFAVQIAKAMEAKVTAVCSAKNVEFVKSLGADEVLAYDRINIHELEGAYSLVIDVHGNLNFSDFERLGSRGVLVGFTGMRQMLSVLLRNAVSNFPLTQFTAQANTKDLRLLADLIQAKKVIPHLENTYPYSKIPKAIKHIEKMRTRGKVTMSWELRAI